MEKERPYWYLPAAAISFLVKVKGIHNALEQKGWRNDITFTIIRDGMKKEITATLPSFKE